MPQNRDFHKAVQSIKADFRNTVRGLVSRAERALAGIREKVDATDESCPVGLGMELLVLTEKLETAARVAGADLPPEPDRPGVKMAIRDG